jgi:hypothetical protein
VTAQICSWSPEIRSTLQETGAAVRQLFVCKLAPSLVALPPTTGHLLTGFRSITETQTWAAAARCFINVPGATPSQLALALGKDGKAYLCNRNNLGGITAPVASANVANSVRGQSAATYRTIQGTYFVFRNGSSAVSAYKITATSPPTIIPAWTVSQNGQGSPWVTTTDGTNNAIVWVVGVGATSACTGTMATPAQSFTQAAGLTNE